MEVKHLKVRGFRGISSLDWTVGGSVIGLIGPGDSTKTTILDAIEYTLSPRWNLPISDCDFYGGSAVSPILIEITIGNVPGELLTEDKFGFYKRGWLPTGNLVDEPNEADEEVLTVQLTISTDLEPSWSVVTDRIQEPKPMSVRDRARLGVVRLGSDVQRDLAWGRGSNLARMTGSVDVDSVLADAYRAARAAVDQQQLAKLVEASENAAQQALPFGAMPSASFAPALDAGAMSATAGAISLHDGPIPVRVKGLGTRRLVALAIQHAVVPDGAIVLADEIEHGLEPHRIRRLIRHLRTKASAPTGSTSCPSPEGQIIMTTHSPVVVTELDVDEVRVVRSANGMIQTLAPASELQPVLRAMPDAFLAKKVVVCEGPTEIGLAWGMEEFWKQRNGSESLACRGVVFVDGQGSSAPERALALARLGYEVCYFADSDDEISPPIDQVSGSGVTVIRWDNAMCTEQRLFADLPWELLQDCLDLAIAELAEESVIAAVKAHLQGLDPSGSDLQVWRASGIAEETIREALAYAAKGNKKRPAWYKRRDRSEKLATIVIRGLPAMPNRDLAVKLASLESWCYA